MNDRRCSVDGCERPHLAHGWCNLHYKRWRNHGDPLVRLRTGGPCTIDGCEKPSSIRGWCKMHWTRWRRYSDPLAGGTLHGSGLRFLANALASQTDECILWPLAPSHRYGRVTMGGDRVPAHVLVCILAHGERPRGMWACHDCGDHENGRCVNPRHLRWATPAENVADYRRFSR